MKKRILLLGLLLAAGFIGLSSCTQEPRALEGTWTVTSNPDTIGTDRILGDGTITLDFLGEVVGFEFYAGSATFGAGAFDYIVDVDYLPGFNVTINLSESGDPDGSYITLFENGYSGGDVIAGDYMGIGLYQNGSASGKEAGDGTFTATKN